MKSILVVCDHPHIDPPLRRSLAHLVKSCEIEIVNDGYKAYEALNAKTFNLIIIDFEITGIDSLELIEMISYTDPGIPIILMLQQTHKKMWGPARYLQANPILRPFKPLTFLRLVDTLLHQHLERYRNLANLLQTTLDRLRAETKTPYALLVDNSRQILTFSGEAEEPLLEALADLTVTPLLTEERSYARYPQHKSLLASTPGQQGHNLYAINVIESLYLGLVAEPGSDRASRPDYWPPLEIAIEDIKLAFQENVLIDAYNSPTENNQLLAVAEEATQRVVLPLQLELALETVEPDLLSSNSVFPPPEEPMAEAPMAEEAVAETPVNWQIITDSAPTILSRLQNFCEIN